MTNHIRPEFNLTTLPTYLGYHLQIFAAGRAKISFQTANSKKTEFYTALPKRDHEGFRRQKKRSLAALPDHFASVDRLLADHPDAKVFRLHAKGDNNATADNAHLLASLEGSALWLVMSGVVHRWALTTPLVHVLIAGKGKRTGEASLFNEYLHSYEHDWEDATFALDDYKVGQRGGGEHAIEVPLPSTPLSPIPEPMCSSPKLENKAPIDPRTETEEDYFLDDPDDHSIFTYPSEDQLSDVEEEFFPDQAEDTAVDAEALKGGIAYGKTGLWAAYKASSKQPGQPRST